MKNYLFPMILLSIALAIVCGIFFPEQTLSLKWIGQIFINMLKLIVLPLIFCTLVSAISAFGGIKKLGSIGFYTLGYVLLSLSIAVIIGLVLLNVFKPGIGIAKELILANSTSPELNKEFSSFLVTLFPYNIVDAAAKYEIMPIVFFSVAFALASISVGETAKPVMQFFIGLRNIFIKMIMWLMNLTPIGLFSLLGAAIAEASLKHLLLQSISGLLTFIFIFIMGLLLHILWQFLAVMFIANKKGKHFLVSSSNALLTAFATSSSLATLPVTLLAAKKQNVNDEISRFVIPLATTINMSGTAMYEAVSALFFCQILGFDLSIWAQIGVFLMAILAGIGASGIPEGGLVTMVMVLRGVNVPTSAIGLLLPFDRILDRCRTMTNVWGDLVCATMVDHFYKKSTQKTKAALLKAL